MIHIPPAMSLSLPSGPVTLLFTDIEGSTRLWEEDPGSMSAALAIHDSILRREIEKHRGVVFKTVGDAFCTVFEDAGDAVGAAVSAQRLLERSGLPFRVRFAMHVGEPEVRDADYFGPPVNRVARLLAAGHGGQILVSESVSVRAPCEGTSLSLRNLGRHRLRDLAEPEEIYQVVGDSLPEDFPPLRTASSAVHNLPALATSFVGRGMELRQLARLLDSGARLITLVGVGGAGKTRLALQLTADALPQLPGGALWVDLSFVRDPERVVDAMADALHIPEQAGRSRLDQVSARLPASRSLLILDNFEQVVEAANVVAALLHACPGLCVIVTSRAALNISGEHEFVVGVMPLSEAATLFEARARQAQRSLIMDPSSRALVESICRRVEGIPLAVELAAAQLRMLTVKQIEVQLSRRIRSLASPYRDVPARQRTLWSTIDWSYGLLSEEDRLLYARLCVFTGGFTIDAAEAVAQSDDTFAGVARLRDQSLLSMVEVEDDFRFSMLESIREYGLEKLEQSGIAPECRRRHADYFARLVTDVDDRLSRGDESAARSIVADVDNVRSALSWFDNERRADDALRLACGMGRIWESEARFREARETLTRCLSLPGATDRSAVRRALGWAGWFAHHQGDYEVSNRLQLESLSLCREQGDAVGQARALNHLALTAAARHDYERARNWYEESLRIAVELGDESMQASRLNNLALLAGNESRLDAAAVHLTAALEIHERLKDTRGIAACHCNLGDLALRTHQWVVAEEQLSQGIRLFRALGDKVGIAVSLANLAQVYAWKCEPDRSRACAKEALEICVEAGIPSLVPPALEALARSEQLDGRLDQATTALNAANGVRRRFKVEPTESERGLVEVIGLPLHVDAAGTEESEGWSLEDVIKGVLSDAASAPLSAEEKLLA